MVYIEILLITDKYVMNNMLLMLNHEVHCWALYMIDTLPPEMEKSLSLLTLSVYIF